MTALADLLNDLADEIEIDPTEFNAERVRVLALIAAVGDPADDTEIAALKAGISFVKAGITNLVTEIAQLDGDIVFSDAIIALNVTRISDLEDELANLPTGGEVQAEITAGRATLLAAGQYLRPATVPRDGTTDAQTAMVSWLNTIPAGASNISRKKVHAGWPGGETIRFKTPLTFNNRLNWYVDWHDATVVDEYRTITGTTRTSGSTTITGTGLTTAVKIGDVLIGPGLSNASYKGTAGSVVRSIHAAGTSMVISQPANATSTAAIKALGDRDDMHLRMRGCTNFRMTRFNVRGRHDGTFKSGTTFPTNITPAEGQHAWVIETGTNYEIDHWTATKVWGDGYYITNYKGSALGGGVTTYPGADQVEVSDFKVFFVGRQGMAPVRCTNVHIHDGDVRDVGRTVIDLEAYLPTWIVDTVLFEDITCGGGGLGDGGGNLFASVCDGKVDNITFRRVNRGGYPFACAVRARTLPANRFENWSFEDCSGGGTPYNGSILSSMYLWNIDGVHMEGHSQAFRKINDANVMYGMTVRACTDITASNNQPDYVNETGLRNARGQVLIRNEDNVKIGEIGFTSVTEPFFGSSCQPAGGANPNTDADTFAELETKLGKALQLYRMYESGLTLSQSGDASTVPRIARAISVGARPIVTVNGGGTRDQTDAAFITCLQALEAELPAGAAKARGGYVSYDQEPFDNFTTVGDRDAWTEDADRFFTLAATHAPSWRRLPIFKGQDFGNTLKGGARDPRIALVGIPYDVLGVQAYDTNCTRSFKKLYNDPATGDVLVWAKSQGKKLLVSETGCPDPNSPLPVGTVNNTTKSFGAPQGWKPSWITAMGVEVRSDTAYEGVCYFHSNVGDDDFVPNEGWYIDSSTVSLNAFAALLP